MTQVHELEAAVTHLSDEDLAAFRQWFAEYDVTVWDRQFEADVAAGRLDKLGEEALAWLARYLNEARPALLKGKTSDALFITARGGAMTRQAFWSLIKRYAAKEA